jgi:Protein of unknown function (DUF3619)
MNAENQNLNEKDLGGQDAGIQDLDIQAKQIADLLDAHAHRLSLRTLKQLETGREHAVKLHEQKQLDINHNGDGTLNVVVSWAEHHRVASAGLLLGAIIAGFVLMQSFGHKEPSDAFLLGADLPPEAFVDRGFEPSLNNLNAKL